MRRKGSITAPTNPMGRAASLLLVSVALACLARPNVLTAQERPDTAAARRDTSVVPQPAISPRSAFFRAIAVPGWGHASLGSYQRGAFYFGTEAATALMLVTVKRRIRAAERVRDLRSAEVEARVRAEGVTDPVVIQARVDADESVAGAQGLVEARSQQFEDWVALGIFLVFLSGADAYVSAHLSGFPGPVRVEPRMPAGDRMELGLSIPVGGPAGR